MMRASIGSNSLLLKPHTALWTLELDLYQEMNGIDSTFLEFAMLCFLLAFSFVLCSVTRNSIIHLSSSISFRLYSKLKCGESRN